MFEQKKTKQREHISAYYYIYSRKLPLTGALAQSLTDFPSLSMPVRGAHFCAVRP